MSESLGQIAATLGVAQPPQTLEVKRIVTDTRILEPGDLFLALRGERFDGHDYLSVARERGAVAAVVDQLQDDALVQLEVADTRLALGLLARARRLAWNGRLAAITGNSGKTSVKAMLASICAQHVGMEHTLATQGNLNNDIGAPLTLLGLQPQHRYAVVELGANHLGEIAWTASLARPDVAVITNVTDAHVGEFGGSGHIAQAKGEILAGLGADGVAVLNRDDRYFPVWQALAGSAQVLDFSLQEAACVTVNDLAGDELGRYAFTLVLNGEHAGHVQLRLLGLHNVRNALAAAAAAHALGIPDEAIVAGLTACDGVPGRLTLLAGINQSRLLDDSYNANPGAVKAALEALATLPSPRWCFLGAMGELGDDTARLHAEIGRHARELKIDFLGTLGENARPAAEAFGLQGHHFDDWASLLAYARYHVPVNASVLVKGSRSAGMERLVTELRADTN
ncbi:UDP-N-acetylmuramoyl-tripeptide--D-alanyl-D-alanine ligase [Phytohalomonas tamaricis]|uniref:UDP-N-acetylmuramoyl-tripeptide--D-alanyl-D- alanine ligase n=1 Tax=Phytohalomonas tamaricis TaxID=2081032 RepID=UPI000D0AC1A9|nr:UDP-N-acetylmuramoyl-tripeptide--D-alanyl-D-alanine ligase [Phytohalomonas tamaricis]